VCPFFYMHPPLRMRDIAPPSLRGAARICIRVSVTRTHTRAGPGAASRGWRSIGQQNKQIIQNRYPHKWQCTHPIGNHAATMLRHPRADHLIARDGGHFQRTAGEVAAVVRDGRARVQRTRARARGGLGRPQLLRSRGGARPYDGVEDHSVDAFRPHGCLAADDELLLCRCDVFWHVL
jgi:hypothetical protein